jgi:hypothetical protein
MNRPSNGPYRTPVILILTATLFFPLFLTQAASGAEATPQLRSFLAKYCFECHDTDSAKGDLNLETLSTNLANGDRMRQWTSVHDRIARREMPPKDALQPSSADLRECTLVLRAARSAAAEAG